MVRDVVFSVRDSRRKEITAAGHFSLKLKKICQIIVIMIECACCTLC